MNARATDHWRQEEDRKEQERKMPGLHFECYERDPQMKEAARRTGQVQTLQTEEQFQRAQWEREQARQVAPNHLSDTDLQAIRDKAWQQELQRRQEGARNNEFLKKQHYDKLSSAQKERHRLIEEERANHNRMRELEAKEREERIINKQLNAAEASHVLTGIEAAKRDRFEQKKNDQSNKIQTIALQEEVAHKVRENVSSQQMVRSGLRQDLIQQNNERAQKNQIDKVESLHGDIASTGFEFECYTRDPMMKEEARRTSGFQRGQQDADRFRRQQDKQ